MNTTNDTVSEDEPTAKQSSQVPEWFLASQGIKLIINNNNEEAQKLFLQHPDSLVMYSGYSFATFMDALMSLDEEKLAKAITTLKEVERRCAADSGWLRHVTSSLFWSDPKPPKPLAEQLETQIILADSQVCIATLIFLQQDISGYLKGGWVLRKAWKVYQRVYKDILQLYRENIGELNLPDAIRTPVSSNPQTSTESDAHLIWDIPAIETNGYTQSSKVPHSKSAYLHETSNGCDFASSSTKCLTANNQKTISKVFKKSTSVNSGLTDHSKNSRWGRFSFNAFHNPFSFYNIPSLHLFSSQNNTKDSQMDIEVIKRLMEAVSFGYGVFQLGISLLPPSLTKLTSILGFSANRQDGLACLMYARRGTDMRGPLATLSLLWYHTIVRPFYAIDGTNVQAGVDTSTILLNESEEEFKDSALFLFFRGRVCRLNSDIKSALSAYQQAVDNTRQREIKILCLHEIGWCHLIELDYCAAENTFLVMKDSSKWSRSFYSYLAAICAGCCESDISLTLLKDLMEGVTGVPKGTQLEEFLNRRAKYCPKDMEEIRQKKYVYWKILVFEMLYLWNTLPSCSNENISKVIADCKEICKKDDEPMRGLSKLILGCAYCIQGMYEEGISSFRKCLEARQDIAPNAEDAHVSAFAQYELGAILIQKEETRGEGKLLLQRMTQYSRYDFEQRLDVRVFSLLKNI